MSSERLDVFQKKFYWGYILTSLLVFSPLKAVAYITPVIFLSFFLFTRPLYVDKFFFKRTLLVVCVWVFLFLVYKFQYPNIFYSTSFFISIVTYSSIYPLVIIKNSRLASRELMEKICAYSRVLFFVQGVIGLIQAFYGFIKFGSFDTANGDHVEGTIHLPLYAELSFSNPMFSCNMIFLFTLLFVEQMRTKKVGNLILMIPGILSLVLASVMHQIGFYLVAIIVSIVMLPNLGKVGDLDLSKIRKVAFRAVLVFVMIGIVFLRSNFSQVISIPRQVITESENIPKAIVTKHAIIDLPYDESMAPIIGLGPGQFSSRAGLIASGYYLGRPDNPKTLPLLTPGSNPYAKVYVIDVLLAFSDVTWFGSTQKPFYSILTIYSELGLIGLVVFMTLVVLYFFKVRGYIKKNGSESSVLYGFGLMILILFQVALGIQLNYYEVVQAIFLGVLIMKLFYSQMSIKNVLPN